MNLHIPTTRTVSLQSSKFDWGIVDSRAEELGLDRSKYTQMLYELDLDHHILSNHKVLDKVKNPRRYDIRILDVVSLFFILAIFTLLITIVWVI